VHPLVSDNGEHGAHDGWCADDGEREEADEVRTVCKSWEMPRILSEEKGGQEDFSDVEGGESNIDLPGFAACKVPPEYLGSESH